MSGFAPPVGPKSRHLLPGSEFGDGTVGVRQGKHLGIDFQPQYPGGSDWIYSVTNGTVVALISNRVHGSKAQSLYAGHTGNVVAVKDLQGRVWSYRHGRNFQVKVGDKVRPGDRLCRMSNTGTVTGVHLHLGLLDTSGRFIDPERVLRAAGVWPIGNTYYTAATPTKPTPAPKKGLSMSDVNKILAEIRKIPANVWGHRIKHPRQDTTSSTGAYLTSGYANSVAVHAIMAGVRELGKQQGFDETKLNKVIDEAVKNAIADGIEVTGTVELNQKGN